MRFAISHIARGHVAVDEKAKTVTVELTLAGPDGTELTLALPYGQLEGVCQALLAGSNAALDAHRRLGRLPEMNHNQPSAFVAETGRALPNVETNKINLQFVGRRAPDAPLGLGSIELNVELAQDTMNDLQKALVTIREHGSHNAETGETAFSFGLMVLNPQKVKFPMQWSPILPEFFPFLAQIALLWGEFERDFNDCIAALIKASNYNEEDWSRLSFTARNGLFRDLSRQVFAGRHVIIRYFQNIFKDAANVQAKRNVLLHGRIVLYNKIEFNKELGRQRMYTKIEANGLHGGKPRRMMFDLSAIENIFYDIAHLTGRVRSLLEADEKADDVSLPLPDRSFLRDFFANNRPHPPTVARRQGPPQPSPA
jgi:hypothetical protein